MYVTDGKLVSAVAVVSGVCSVHEYLMAVYVREFREGCFLCDLLVICTQDHGAENWINACVQTYF